jgi:hypothetical protein
VRFPPHRLRRRQAPAAGPDEWWVYLDQPYRAVRVEARAFYELHAEPSRKRAA